ncbi:MAG: acetyl-CoA carboxylase, carboxyltransferase subunit beta [Chitinophagales bacterium]|nr:acetyl-CoA carboxylase, carboxyltransferase subunit beta [Chitinophagales bacterium]MCO5281498.1 acetyl-CoA carboxylase, carboxyltransferase subunit beta [Chitinophagales bacterium]OJV28447.1 MAG: acetyl-CoA carboxylase subunit beta [Bacteroidetes bacterium 37-13]HRP38548.1 acetyl-CoA carboxylase, carboxyltransferase subunit beta [Chitinophagales bacterium]
MSWWKRIRKGVETSTSEKKEAPDGVWHQCTNCKKASLVTEMKAHAYTCPLCNHHEKIDADDYFDLIFDKSIWEEKFSNLVPVDTLEFADLKPYKQRIHEATVNSGLKEAMRVGYGKAGGENLTIAAMDFRFIGGSMGSVVGEKIAFAIDWAIENKSPLLIISKSGGARMQESAFSLMQMAKTSAKLTQLANAKLPYISLLTNPTTGGVTASFAMLGDFNIAEPGALIGFAGPRVIEETIKKKLPEGFQTSEFQLENGFLDFIVDRKQLRDKIITLLDLLKN